MNKTVAIIQKENNDLYRVFIPNNAQINGVGETIKEAKKRFESRLNYMIEARKANGIDISELLDITYQEHKQVSYNVAIIKRLAKELEQARKEYKALQNI